MHAMNIKLLDIQDRVKRQSAQHMHEEQKKQVLGKEKRDAFKKKIEQANGQTALEEKSLKNFIRQQEADSPLRSLSPSLSPRSPIRYIPKTINLKNYSTLIRPDENTYNKGQLISPSLKIDEPVYQSPLLHEQEIIRFEEPKPKPS